MYNNRTRFVIVSTQRSGSTWLTDLLNSHPDIAGYTELFLAKGEGAPNWGRYRDMLYWQTYRKDLRGFGRHIRPLGVYRYLDEAFARHPDKRAVGLKLMYTQIAMLPETLLYLRSRDVRVIHLLRRNVLDVVLSGLAKSTRKLAHAQAGAVVERVKLHVEPDWLLRQLAKRQREQRWFAYLLKRLGVPYLELVYEDIADDRSRLAGCLEYLGCRPMELGSDMAKLNPKSHAELLENIDEVAAGLSSTSFGSLLRI